MSHSPPAVDDEAAWRDWRGAWSLREDTTYLNHGSFGPPPNVVREARRAWIDRLDEQPMDFFVRTLEPAWFAAREQLATFVGSRPEHLVFVENATTGMNLVAANTPLAAGDEVLLTDHEYGAVNSIWRRACDRSGARLRIATLSLPFTSGEQVVDDIFRQVGPNTRLLVVSHITSATATILPVEAICRQARQRGLSVCVDGPHAVAQVPLAIDDLDCDYYTASCHKWLCAPFGSGFLFVHPRRQDDFAPQQLSWGRVESAEKTQWCDEFVWTGTRDPSAYLTVPAAIDFMEHAGLDVFRRRSHHLAAHARRRLMESLGAEPLVPDDAAWYGSMALLRLPDGDRAALQRALWTQYGIEVPIIDFAGRRYVRVSCHLYNTVADIDRLVVALSELLG
ncbi:MAG: aminotransferase class V-fold PLP-dependent enzyme [Pirellulaceae bacterium]